MEQPLLLVRIIYHMMPVNPQLTHWLGNEGNSSIVIKFHNVHYVHSCGTLPYDFHHPCITTSTVWYRMYVIYGRERYLVITEHKDLQRWYQINNWHLTVQHQEPVQYVWAILTTPSCNEYSTITSSLQCPSLHLSSTSCANNSASCRSHSRLLCSHSLHKRKS